MGSSNCSEYCILSSSFSGVVSQLRVLLLVHLSVVEAQQRWW